MALLIPISDDNPTRQKPYVTWTILAVNVGIWFIGVATQTSGAFVMNWGLIPAKFQLTDLITSQFVHGGLMHLAGNMLFYWVFGDNVEDHFGRAWYLLVYLCSGAAGAIGHAIAVSGTDMANAPLVGASGALAGVMAAYLVIHPHQPVRIFYLVLLYPGTFSVRAIWVIGVWAGQQLFMVALTRAGESGVAYWAHVIGFLTGLSFALADRWVRGVPEEILPPARGSHIPFARPVEELDVPMAALPAVTSGFAVIRADDAQEDNSGLGRLIAGVTGEKKSDTTMRVRRSRGVLARGLSHEKARFLSDSLRAAGGPPTVIIDERLAPPLPPHVPASSAACGPPGFEFDVQNQKWTVPWSRVAAVFAARVDGLDSTTTLVEVFTHHPFGRIRLAVSRTSDAPESALREFCASILRHRGSIPINNGVAVLAGRGNWGYLRFANPHAYEDYAWWLIQLIRARAGKGSFIEMT